jgi:amidase
MPHDASLIHRPATEIHGLLLKGEVSPHDLLDALEARIAAVEPAVNALPTLCLDRARRHADALMRKPMAERGRLAGLPVPIKDLTEVAGVRTTYGSPIFSDFVPDRSCVLVEHLEAEGGIIYAKSNTPEFGAGAQTFNEVFGQTRNPWNTGRSPAGSSGGAAVALATGMAWLAHGSDLGGSLRNPASFCGIVGLRPSVGRVARTPSTQLDRSMSVEGPMARNVEDLALLLDAMAGEEIADPLSLPREPLSYLAAARARQLPKRVAVSVDLGLTPVDPQVAAALRGAAEKLAASGVIVEEAHPDLSGAHEVFQTLRAFAFALSKAELLRTHRDKLKPEVIWNIEKGLALTMDDIERAEARRLAIFAGALDFFARYDALLTPATIVPAFPVTQRYLTECNGVAFSNYVEWLGIVYAITLLGTPALSIPCGFSREGLPIGLQVVGRPRGEAALLSAARAMEDILAVTPRAPIDPCPGA